MGISLISLGKRAKCWIVFLKMAKAKFFITKSSLIVCVFWFFSCNRPLNIYFYDLYFIEYKHIALILLSLNSGF